MELEERVNLALKLGWSIEKNLTLTPPKKFDCANWASIFTQYKLPHGNILIPEYFFNDTVLIIGTRGDEPLTYKIEKKSNVKLSSNRPKSAITIKK